MKRVPALTIAVVCLFGFIGFSDGALVAFEGKSWKDIDYVGDGIFGHRLDIYLTEKGAGPFPARQPVRANFDSGRRFLAMYLARFSLIEACG